MTLYGQLPRHVAVVKLTASTGASFADKNAAVGKAVNVSGFSIGGADATN